MTHSGPILKRPTSDEFKEKMPDAHHTPINARWEFSINGKPSSLNAERAWASYLRLSTVVECEARLLDNDKILDSSRSTLAVDWKHWERHQTNVATRLQFLRTLIESRWGRVEVASEKVPLSRLLSLLARGIWLFRKVITKAISLLWSETWQIEIVGPKKRWILKGDPGNFVADTFPAALDGRRYVFYENYISQKKKGILEAREFHPESGFGSPFPVLETPYHLSYPYVWSWEGQWFMVPESSRNRTVDLYQAAEFPYHWTKVQTLLSDIQAVDSSLFFHQGHWWLFASVADDARGSTSDSLHLFFADDFRTDRWTPHPLNPIVQDVRRARPAGRPFVSGGKLYRPAQDCSVRYGYAVRLQEIVELTETTYCESDGKILRPRSGTLGIHTYNVEEGWIYTDSIKRQKT